MNRHENGVENARQTEGESVRDKRIARATISSIFFFCFKLIHFPKQEIFNAFPLHHTRGTVLGGTAYKVNSTKIDKSVCVQCACIWDMAEPLWLWFQQFTLIWDEDGISQYKC